MTYRRTADTGCPDGPCPVMARNDSRGTVALQGYDPQEDLDLAMGLQPPRESRIEMQADVLVGMLADHLTDEEVDRLLELRAERRAAA